MARPEIDKGSSIMDSIDDPPLLSIVPWKLSDLPKKRKPWSADHLPVDILLLSGEDCEFVACYHYLRDPFKSYEKSIGYVYFGKMGEDEDESLRVALVKCSKDSSDPGGSQTAAKNAITLLRPKATVLVGFCYSPSPEKAQLGDVVISSKLTTSCYQTPVSRDVGNLVRSAADGWKAPVENPEACEVKIHCDGEILSCSDLIAAEQQCQLHPKANAVEMAGKGLFAAAHDMKTEWLVVKGVCDFVHGSGSTNDLWKTFACVMAASVVSNMLSDSSVFEDWPNHGDNLAREGSGDSDDSSNYKRKRVAEYSPEQTFDVKTCRSKLAEHYKRTATVPTSVWSKVCPVKIDQIYTRLSVVKEEQAPFGSSHLQLNHYTEVFIDGEGNGQKRILVQGQTGIGKTTFVKKVAVDWAELNDENIKHDMKLAKSQNCEVESIDGSVKGLDEIHKLVLKKFELVLVVNLKEASKCRTLREVICHCNIFPEEDSALVDEMLSYVAKNQEKVLLVFDGYDEYGCGRNSEIYDIFRRKKLRSCCVLITTRISKADELREFKDVHAEITGFSEWDRFSFMRRLLGSETDANELGIHLFKENLLDLAKIPLLLLFFCTLWKKGKVKTFPDTKTNLYLAIVQCVVDYNQGKSSPAQFSKLEDFQDILAEMGKVALECLLKDDHVFEYDQLSAAIRCGESRVIGLLQVTEYAENLRPAGVVSFIHKSIQEFLAAWYITNRCVPEKCLGGMEKHALTLESCAAWENVFQFICGLSNDGAVVVLDHFTSVRIATPDLDLSKTVSDIDSNTDPPLNDLTYRQVMFNDLVFNSLQEVQSKGELLQSCFDCVGSVILVTTSLSCLLQKMERETVGRVTNSLVFVYESSLRVPVWALYQLIKILRCPQSSELLTVDNFLQKLTEDRGTFSLSDFHSVLLFRNGELQFYLTRVSVGCNEFVELFNASFGASASSGSEDTCIENSVLKFLRVFQCNCILEEKAREALWVIIRHCKSLKRIVFGGNGYHVCEILKQVPNPSECYVLLGATFHPFLDELHLSTAEIEELAKLLPRFHNIVTLCVNFFPWTTKAIDTLVTSLTHHSFEVLVLRGIQLTSAVVEALGRSLPDMSRLQTLELTGSDSRILGKEDMKRLFGGFHKTMPLHRVTFTGFNIKACIGSVSKYFRFFPYLSELDLGKFSDLNHDDLQVLLWSLRCSFELRKLRVCVEPQDLPHCCQEKFTTSCTFAHKNLRALKLEGIRLTPLAAAILGQSLSEMPLLEQLEITGGVNEKILQEEDIEALFSGFNKPALPLLKLTFSGFEVSCLHPLTKRFKFLANVEEVHLEKVNMDEHDLSCLLKSLKSRIDVLSIQGNSLGCPFFCNLRFQTEMLGQEQKKLDLEELSLTTATAAALGRSLPEMLALKELRLCAEEESNLQPDEFEALFGGFHKALPLLEKIICGFMVKGSLVPLTNSLRFFPNLRCLCLAGNLDERNSCDLLKSLRFVPHLEMLVVKGNQLDFNDCFLPGSDSEGVTLKFLKRLELDGVTMTLRVAKLLGLLLPEMSALKTLALTGVEGSILEENHLEALFAGLNNMMSLKTLSLRGFSMTNCLVPVSKRLHYLSSLTKIIFDQLLIDECKLCSFLESLGLIPCLQCLSLKIQSQITADCCTREANKDDCLKLTSLQQLNLNGACVTPLLAKVLGRSLPEMSSLNTLEIIGMDSILREEDLESLFGGFNKTMSLTSLTFNNFSVKGCLTPLTRKLPFLPNLKYLDLKMLDLDCLDLCSVLEALREARGLKKLTLSSEQFVQEVTRVVQHFFNLATGCFVVIDETASEDVLREVRDAIKQTRPDVSLLPFPPGMMFMVFHHSNAAEKQASI